MRLVNLTPHAIHLAGQDGRTVMSLPPSGTSARVASTPGAEQTIEGIPVPVKAPDVYGDVQGLPAPQDGVMYVVSALVGARCAGRSDVLVPGTGPADNPVREEGRIMAVRCLKRVS